MLPKFQTNKETSGGADKLAVSGRSDEPSGGADGAAPLLTPVRVAANGNKDAQRPLANPQNT